jgi:hypothetical protein
MDSDLQSTLNTLSSSIVIPRDLVLKTIAAGLIVWALAWICIRVP